MKEKTVELLNAFNDLGYSKESIYLLDAYDDPIFDDTYLEVLLEAIRAGIPYEDVFMVTREDKPYWSKAQIQLITQLYTRSNDAYFYNEIIEGFNGAPMYDTEHMRYAITAHLNNLPDEEFYDPEADLEELESLLAEYELEEIYLDILSRGINRGSYV